MFEQLSRFRKIGWDFDETLIDSPRSPLFWDFIRANPYGQEHHIVTFRSAGLEHNIFPDLENRGSDLRRSDFAGVHNIAHELWRDHHTSQPRIIIELDADDPYLVWKGATCAQHGIEVLIDDMTHHVIHGCRKHDIVHFHPDDLV